MGQSGVIVGCRCSSHSRTGKIQFHGTAAHLVLQLHNDSLGNLFTHALGSGEHLFIPGHDSQGEILRTAGRENGHGGLGTYAVDRGQQFKAALLLFADKAVKIVSILPNGFGDIEPGRLIQLQLRRGIGGDTAAVTHAAAFHHGKTGLQNGHRTGNIIYHNNLLMEG